MTVINPNVRAVLWDFGGVLTTSPFEAFNRYERANGLPLDFIRGVNSTNGDTNAWSQLESNAISREDFDGIFLQESKLQGHAIRGAEVLALLAGELRPRMVKALAKCKTVFKVGCITNNIKPSDPISDSPETRQFINTGPVMAMFDSIIESSIEGVRKPDPRIYSIACSRLGVKPSECIFLDDLGINLKPARLMGMTTIKVVDPDEAIQELQHASGLIFD